jgi:hypothetical protein
MKVKRMKIVLAALLFAAAHGSPAKAIVILSEAGK